MIADYLNQTITLKTKSSVNTYNESTFTTSSIKARFEYRRRLIRNSLGEQVISEATVFSLTEIKPDDTITYDGIDWVVLRVSKEVDLFGDVSHYEVML